MLSAPNCSKFPYGSQFGASKFGGVYAGERGEKRQKLKPQKSSEILVKLVNSEE